MCVYVFIRKCGDERSDSYKKATRNRYDNENEGERRETRGERDSAV